MFKRVNLLILMICLILLSGCNIFNQDQNNEDEILDLPNPASVYCEEQGYKLEMRTDENGTYGVCIFPDGSECEEWSYFRGECQPGESSAEAKPEAVDLEVVAWYGKVISAPEGIPAESKLILYPEGTGEVYVTGETGEVENEILSIRDVEPPGRDAHFWGRLMCPPENLDECLLTVSRMRVWGPGEFFEPEEVEGWVGVIYSGPPGPRSGGDDYFALAGPFNIQYGIHGADENIQAQIETVRDTGKPAAIWGQLTTGIPDWNSTQILVTQVQPISIELDGLAQPPQWEEVDTGWLTYTNATFGYIFNYPPLASVTEVDGDTCIHIEYSLGYIYISAPSNQGSEQIPCGRTGVGVGEVVDKTEEVIVNGQAYTAVGFEWLGGGETLNLHNETMVVTLPDGTRIEYGASPREDAVFLDYTMKTREILLMILASFQPIE